MEIFPSWQWTAISGTISCSLDGDELTVSGSGTGWSASGTTVSVSPTPNVSSYYRLELEPPQGHSFPGEFSETPVIRYFLGDHLWNFVSNKHELLLYNVISGTGSAGTFEADIALSGETTPFPIMISFTAQGEV